MSWCYWLLMTNRPAALFQSLHLIFRYQSNKIPLWKLRTGDVCWRWHVNHMKFRKTAIPLLAITALKKWSLLSLWSDVFLIYFCASHHFSFKFFYKPELKRDTFFWSDFKVGHALCALAFKNRRLAKFEGLQLKVRIPAFKRPQMAQILHVSCS